jgi:hypothetical protein
MTLRSHFNLDLIANAVRALPDFRTLGAQDLRIMTGKGLTHDHIAISHTGWLLRVPRRNQLDMTPDDYLDYQQKCYAAASQSGHAPACLTTIHPQTGLTQGALVIQTIEGRKPLLPQDWPAMAKALAALHSLPPERYAQAVQASERPFASQDFLLNTLFRPSYEQSVLPPESRALMDAELQSINDFLHRQKQGQKGMALLGGDSHPANFMIDKAGKAWLVDLEFMLADMPHIDLADAGLPLTANLEPDIRPCHDAVARTSFYKAWVNQVPSAMAQDFEPAMDMAERMVRMRSLLWLCDWTTKPAQDRVSIPAETARHWDAMAGFYLKPDILRTIFKKDIYLALPAASIPPTPSVS